MADPAAGRSDDSGERGAAVLCRLADIPDGGSAAFAAMIDGARQALMALRRGRRVFVYRNRCPHLGWPLDIVAGRFLSDDGRYILCTGHGALFEVDDGACIKGPCRGASLTRVPARLDGDRVLIDAGTPAPPPPARPAG